MDGKELHFNAGYQKKENLKDKTDIEQGGGSFATFT